MGMFDTVLFECPKCKAEIDAQSKAGHSVLDTFDYWLVPKVVAEDVARRPVNCESCKSMYKPIKIFEYKRLVTLNLRPWR